MTDPEAVHAELVSGDPAGLRSAGAVLAEVLDGLDDAWDSLGTAARRPHWSGDAAVAFQGRIGGLSGGLVVMRARIGLLGTLIESGAKTYEAMREVADEILWMWQRRPAGLPEPMEKLFRNLINIQFRALREGYGQDLMALASFTTEDPVDLDALDDDMREWIEDGRRDTEDWLTEDGRDLGPLIPNTYATGDSRNLVPQGLAYDDDTDNLLQVYYDKDNDDGKGSGPSAISVIDNATGEESAHVYLGGGDSDYSTPIHAGGVAISGDKVYVTSAGKDGDPPQLFVYSKADLMRRGHPIEQDGDLQPSEVIQPIEGPHELPRGASAYVAVKEGDPNTVYVGDFTKKSEGPGRLYEIDENRLGDEGGLAAATRHPIITPPEAQGVVVADNGQFIYSTSWGRDAPGALVLATRDGDEVSRTDLPNMAEGIALVDGKIVTTYESGAEHYSSDNAGGLDWGTLDDDEALWLSAQMTRTPLSELGLTSGEVEADPQSIVAAGGELFAVSDAIDAQSTAIGGARVSGAMFGRVPAGNVLASRLSALVDAAGDRLRTGAEMSDRAAQNLRATARSIEVTDDRSRERQMRIGQRLGG
ncbi:WXG100 family type VII secretion target [Microbacterium sp. NPDC058342]|uniref:WXG100 family type VII secretion target n=1 Tax=Microbacterium sp. NPDC058342 TaxID=3346454 RepID=UPI003651FED7